MADDGRIAYDALHDPELTRRLLQAIADGGRAGPLCFAHEPGADIDTSLDSLVLTGEQSNTSLMFGEASHPQGVPAALPGPNPDLEVPRALAMRGSTHVAEPLGWIETRLDGAPVILGILSRYLRAAIRRLVTGRDQRAGPVRGRGPDPRGRRRRRLRRRGVPAGRGHRRGAPRPGPAKTRFSRRFENKIRSGVETVRRGRVIETTTRSR